MPNMLKAGSLRLTIFETVRKPLVCRSGPPKMTWNPHSTIVARRVPRLHRNRVQAFPNPSPMSCSHLAVPKAIGGCSGAAPVMWICVFYLAGMAVFLTIAEQAPVDPGRLYSDDDQNS